MRRYKTEAIDQQIVVGLQCDCCKKDYTDEMDTQEFVCIDDTGGFNSVIGDGVHYRCDLCSACVKMLLGKYLRRIPIK